MGKQKWRRLRVTHAPAYAMRCVELAGKFNLPKEEIKSELERIVRKIRAEDYEKMAKSEGIELDSLMGEILPNEIEEVLDRAIKEGVGKDLIKGAASNYLHYYIKTSEDILREGEIFQRFQKKYAILRQSIARDLLNHYHKDMK